MIKHHKVERDSNIHSVAAIKYCIGENDENV